MQITNRIVNKFIKFCRVKDGWGQAWILKFGPFMFHDLQQWDLGKKPLIALHFCHKDSSQRIFSIGNKNRA